MTAIYLTGGSPDETGQSRAPGPAGAQGEAWGDWRAVRYGTGGVRTGAPTREAIRPRAQGLITDDLGTLGVIYVGSHLLGPRAWIGEAFIAERDRTLNPDSMPESVNRLVYAGLLECRTNERMRWVRITEAGILYYQRWRDAA